MYVNVPWGHAACNEALRSESGPCVPCDLWGHATLQSIARPSSVTRTDTCYNQNILLFFSMGAQFHKGMWQITGESEIQ
jgi:hypothetical protein